jgi:hypothetical protein
LCSSMRQKEYELVILSLPKVNYNKRQIASASIRSIAAVW